MPLTTATAADRKHIRFRPILLAGCAALLFQAGCINVMAITGKVLFGDPVVTSTFEQQTEVCLAEGHTVGLVCTAPASLTSEFDALHLDVQQSVIRRMRLHGLDVVDSNLMISALDSSGGRFSEQALADGVPGMDYLLHVELARFTTHEESSPALYRGRAHGTVVGYQVHRGGAAGAATPIPVFQQDFTVEYPSSYPISADQMSQSTFVRRCIDEISDVVGVMFYDVPTSELF